METRRLRVIMNVKLRPFNPSDLIDVVDIARKACRNPWEEKDFLAAASTRNVVLQVAVRGERIVGYVVRQNHKDFLQILNIAVHPDFQRHRIGEQIMESIQARLHRNRRKFVVLDVSEHDMGMQLFLRDQGYKAVAVQRDQFGEDDDAYVFEKGIEDADDLADRTVVPSEVTAR